MSDFFNEKTKSLKVCEIRMTPKKRNPGTFEELAGREWDVESFSRGKETKLRFHNNGKEIHDLLLYFFKGGCWEWYENETSVANNPNYARDHRFSLHMSDGSIMSQQDQFHQSHWKWRDMRFQWGAYRSPDIVLEHNSFRRHMFEMRKHPFLKNPVYVVMMNKYFFNGLNNFSRSEILARTRFSPFTPMTEILSAEILREDLFEISREVLEDIYRLGGMQFGVWKNPFGVSNLGLREWVQVYRPFNHSFFKVSDNKTSLYVHNKWKSEYEIWITKLRPEDALRISLDGPFEQSDI